MSVTERPSLDEACEKLEALLSREGMQGQTIELVRGLFADKFLKLIHIRLDEPVTRAAMEKPGFLKASDALIELVSAVAASDWDKIVSIDHQIRS